MHSTDFQHQGNFDNSVSNGSMITNNHMDSGGPVLNLQHNLVKDAMFQPLEPLGFQSTLKVLQPTTTNSMQPVKTKSSNRKRRRNTAFSVPENMCATFELNPPKAKKKNELKSI